jgi:hypothetical protein
MNKQKKEDLTVFYGVFLLCDDSPKIPAKPPRVSLRITNKCSDKMNHK